MRLSACLLGTDARAINKREAEELHTELSRQRSAMASELHDFKTLR